MNALIAPSHRALFAALAAGLAALLLPFLVALSPEKAVSAHLIGLVISALAAKSIWWPGRGDGLLLAGAGALAIVVPVFAWQMPAGGGWALPILGLVTAGLGILHSARGAEAAHPAPLPSIAEP